RNLRRDVMAFESCDDGSVRDFVWLRPSVVPPWDGPRCACVRMRRPRARWARPTDDALHRVAVSAVVAASSFARSSCADGMSARAGPAHAGQGGA
ncbi:hypothetical protein KGP93_38750, partial [Burkholderia multivorans]|nr:hypothetical protein [Burkholderia multivorans]